MIRYLPLLFALLFASWLQAADKSAADELQQKIDSSHGGKKAHLLMELANSELEQADRSYQDGNVSKAEPLLEASTKNANQATAEALESGKRLKDTEIDLRKLSEKMQAIRQNIALEDRNPLDISIQQIEQNRTKLLDRMFTK